MPSVSVSKGEGSLNHNNRKFKTANVDPSRTHLNIILKKPCQKVLQNAYHELFDNALQKYNGRQKRDDRKIKNYLSHIQNSKQEKPFHEVVVQIGNKDNKEDWKQGFQTTRLFCRWGSRAGTTGEAMKKKQLKIYCSSMDLNARSCIIPNDIGQWTATKRSRD